MISFLQSTAWKGFQESLGRKTYTDHGKGWSYLAIRESGAFNTRLYAPYGPQCSTLEEFDAALTSLKDLAIRERVTFLRIDPPVCITPQQLRKRKLLPVTYQQLQPAHTQIIDLQQPEEDILAQMSQNSRNITRNYQKKGVTVRTSNDVADIVILTSLLSRVASRNGIIAHSDTYFRAQAKALFPTAVATLYIADYKGKPIAAALIYDSEDTRTYAHAAADDEYRKLSAGTALVGQMILDAKRKGLKFFDLYGIADTDAPSHPWAVLLDSRKSFGGSSIERPGTWDLPLNLPTYWFYRLYQTVRRKFN